MQPYIFSPFMTLAPVLDMPVHTNFKPDAVDLGGMFPLSLCAICGLNEPLHRAGSSATIPLWARHPFWYSLAVLTLAWIGQVIVKNKGIINLDEVMPIRQYIGLTPRTNDCPVLDTLVYGLAYTLEQSSDSLNLPNFYTDA
ncbi:MAG: hypothetical protein GXY67_12665 [Clostridiales bacterium]|nr:hypothetical protein [Clostridiales bacterium]